MVLQNGMRHAGPVAALTDQHDRIVAVHIVKPSVNFLNRHVDRARQMGFRVFARRADVDELHPLARFKPALELASLDFDNVHEKEEASIETEDSQFCEVTSYG